MFFRKYPPEYTVIAVFIAIGLVLQLTALSNSGFFSDEFLHIEAGRHPAWGYSDFPPMIAAFAWIQNLFNTDSVFINHLFNLAASAMAVLFCGLTTIKLGGKWLAVLATLLCILLSPGIAGTRFLFLPTAFDQLFWIICIYCSASYCQSQNARYLIWFCIFGALGFLTKYSIVFLFAGMLTSSLIFRRDIFLKKSLWIGLLIFLVLITPNLCWQIKNQFPTFNGRGIKEAFSFFKSLHNDILASRTVRDSVYFQIQTIQINFLCVMLFVCFLVLRKRKMVLFFPCRNRGDSVRHGLFRAIIAEKKMDNLRIPHRTRINRRLPLASRNPYYQAPEIYRTIP